MVSLNSESLVTLIFAAKGNCSVPMLTKPTRLSRLPDAIAMETSIF